MPIETVAQERRPAGVTPAAAPWRVRAVNVQPNYRLSITCNDGTSGIVDMSALVNGPNGADLDSAWVHEELRKNKTWSVPV